MSRSPWDSPIESELNRLQDARLFRERHVSRAIDATHIERNGRVLINFASNSYLGLTHHPRVIAAATEALQRDGAGSGAAPLISGYGPAHAELEKTIAKWKGTEAAIILPSGYQANFALIQTATAIGRLGKGVRFLIDKLSHASLIDAVQQSGAPFRVFPHNGLSKLRRLLEDAPADQLQIVVTESVFSMDGDAADLTGLIKLKREFQLMLLLDEAHATGVFGPSGNGLAAECGATGDVDASVITFSKSLGTAGAAVCGSNLFCQVLVNHARAYLFSTSPPPATMAATQASIDVIQAEPQRMARLKLITQQMREAIGQMGFTMPDGEAPIIPLIFATEEAALAAAQHLEVDDLLAVAIRPPTVPRGSSRLRITLCCEHSDSDLQRLCECLRKFPIKNP